MVRQRIPGLGSETERALLAIVAGLEAKIAALGAGPPQRSTQTGNFLARPGETVNVSAPAAGLTALLPAASSVLKGARATLLLLNSNPVTLACSGGTVNGASSVIAQGTGALECVCDGANGWAVSAVALDGSVSNAQLADMAASRIKLAVAAGPPIDGTITQALDMMTSGSTRGSLPLRGAAAWASLVPGTNGHVLTANGTGADPAYEDPSVAVDVLTANNAATNSASNMSFTVHTVEANDWNAGTLFRLSGHFLFEHTAAATPTLTAELLVGGSVVETAVLTPFSTALTYAGKVEAIVCCRSTGSPGTMKTDLQFHASAGVNSHQALVGSLTVANNNLTTTVSRELRLRIRMTTAVASNTLTVVQGYTERLRL